MPLLRWHTEADGARTVYPWYCEVGWWTRRSRQAGVPRTAWYMYHRPRKTPKLGENLDNFVENSTNIYVASSDSTPEGERDRPPRPRIPDTPPARCPRRGPRPTRTRRPRPRRCRAACPRRWRPRRPGPGGRSGPRSRRRHGPRPRGRPASAGPARPRPGRAGPGQPWCRPRSSRSDTAKVSVMPEIMSVMSCNSR